MTAPKATYEVIYNGTNITGDIVPLLITLSYTDKSSSESDELQLTISDKDGLWQNEWYPAKGDKISAKIFHLGNTLNCGVFQVDEITLSSDTSGGDNINIKGLAAGISNNLRTKNSFAHENKTLREIANTIASKHGFTVLGNIDNVSIGRETQHHETDLRFLKRVASDYGYTFSIRDNKLIFTNIFEIEGRQAALTIHRNEMISYSITDKTSDTYKSVRFQYHNPRQKKVLSYEKSETSDFNTDLKNDVYEMRIRAENKQQAEIKGKVALYRLNSLQQSGNVLLPGKTLALSGNNCELQGIGACSGKFYIESSTHSVDLSGGYTTNLEIKRVGLIDKSKYK